MVSPVKILPLLDFLSRDCADHSTDPRDRRGGGRSGALSSRHGGGRDGQSYFSLLTSYTVLTLL